MEMELLVVCFVALFVIGITLRVYRWRNPKYSNVGMLPPGSMGLPLLGETLQFFTPTTSLDVPPFIKDRIHRYGSVFKTNLVGRPLIVSADPELNNLIFGKEEKLFEMWYPDSFENILGKQNMANLHGYIWRYIKDMVHDLLGPKSLKTMLPELEHGAVSNLNKWSSQDSVEVKDATAALIFDLSAKKLISYDSEKSSSENMRESFVDFIEGLLSFPLNIPGTAYYKCLQGRKKIMQTLQKMLEERKSTSRKKEQTDFFDYILEELGKSGTLLTEAIALDLMFLLLFASFETTSLALTMAIKFLAEHPLTLKELTEEHETIITKRDNPDSQLTWEEYRSMKFTFQVINETVRLANIAPVLFRKALKDINFNGYTIPAGWGVVVCPPAIHLNHAIYTDPLAFNPWRWEGKEASGASRNFMAFGGGMRFCSGTDFAKLEIAVFLHCLVTKYRWEAIKGGEIVRTPGLQFPNGYHVKFYPK